MWERGLVRLPLFDFVFYGEARLHPACAKMQLGGVRRCGHVGHLRSPDGGPGLASGGCPERSKDRLAVDRPLDAALDQPASLDVL